MAGKLKKTIFPVDALFMAVGAIIGFAVFMLPGESFLIKGGPLGTWIGLAIGAVATMIVAYSYGYLIKRYPICGGSFTFTLIAFPDKYKKPHAFVSAWFLAIAYISLLCVNAVGAGLVMRYIFPGVFSGPMIYQIAGWNVYLGELIIAIIVAVIFAVVNLRGMNTTKWAQNAIVLVLLGSFLIVLSMTLIKGVDYSNFAPAFPDGVPPISAILAIACMCPFLFMGYDVIPQAAEEYKFSSKQAYMLMCGSIIISAFVYGGNTFISASFMPWQEMILHQNSWNVGWAVEEITGRLGLYILGTGMMCGIFSGINSFYTTASRVFLAMARADALPEWFGKIDDKSSIPGNAVKFILVIALFSPFLGRSVILWIVDMLSVGMAITYGYSALSAAIIAKKHNDTIPMVVAIAGFVISVFFIVMQLIPGSPAFLPVPSLIILGLWSFIGIGFYIYQRKKYLASEAIYDILKECEDCKVD